MKFSSNLVDLRQNQQESSLMSCYRCGEETSPRK